MSRHYRPIAAALLPEALAARLAAEQSPGAALRVALDGPDCASPVQLAERLLAPLRALGRPAELIRADTFWRDASLRFEHGREDVDAYYSWLDAAALRREVLEPLGPHGSGSYLPSLRDPATNRATRAPARRAQAGSVVVVAGELLLGLGLPFDLTLHLAVSPGARRRRTDAAAAWTLAALDRYDREVGPVQLADVAIRYDDPERPALSP